MNGTVHEVVGSGSKQLSHEAIRSAPSWSGPSSPAVDTGGDGVVTIPGPTIPREWQSAVGDALGTGADADVLTAFGREYGEAFNKLDGTRSPFIETDERDELVDALDATVDVAEATLGCSFPQARSQLRAGLESVRTW